MVIQLIQWMLIYLILPEIYCLWWDLICIECGLIKRGHTWNSLRQYNQAIYYISCVNLRRTLSCLVIIEFGFLHVLTRHVYSTLHIYLPMSLHVLLLCRHQQRLPATEINRTRINLVFFFYVPFISIRGKVWLVKGFRCSRWIFAQLAGVSLTYSASGKLVFKGGQNFLNFTSLYKCNKYCPLDGQTRWAKSSLQLVNLLGAWC